MPFDICIVTPGHLGSSPRVVKEASALQQAGFSVIVVASDHYELMRPLDASILQQVQWRYHPVRPTSRRLTQIAKTVRREYSRRCVLLGLRSVNIAAHALHSRFADFAAAASAIQAKLYIGHTLTGLTAAAKAASLNHALLGFDAEDWHSEEQFEAQLAPGEKKACTLIEDKLLPLCHHLTASSPLIAEIYAKKAGRPAMTVLNVFPRSEAPTQALPAADRKKALYWFSQTIGQDRGLEQIMDALRFLPEQWELHLRGQPAQGYRNHVLNSASLKTLGTRISFLPLTSPDQLVRLSAEYAVGLAVEPASPGNRARCLANKIFTYLLAGTPVVLSDTPAHRLIAKDFGPAARIVPLDDLRTIAEAVKALCNEESTTHAWRLGQSRYNWEYESAGLVRTIHDLLSRSRSTS